MIFGDPSLQLPGNVTPPPVEKTCDLLCRRPGSTRAIRDHGTLTAYYFPMLCRSSVATIDLS